MCIVKLRDILLPTNVLGKNIRCVSYDTTDVPVVDDKKTLTVTWAGERIEFSYTTRHVYINGPKRKTEYRKNKEILAGTGTETRTFRYGPRNPQVFEYLEPMIYFKCTNVTSLIVDGQQLI